MLYFASVSSSPIIDIVYAIALGVGVLAALGFSSAYVWSTFKKNTGDISQKNLRDYKERVELLEEKVIELDQSVSDLTVQNKEQAVQLETFKNYPLDWQKTSREIAVHMDKSNRLLEKLFKRLDKLEKASIESEKLLAQQLVTKHKLTADQLLKAEELTATQLLENNKNKISK